jgi:hypothetical protein
MQISTMACRCAPSGSLLLSLARSRGIGIREFIKELERRDFKTIGGFDA